MTKKILVLASHLNPNGAPLWRKILLGLLSGGLVLSIALGVQAPSRFWNAYLLNYFFWLGILLAGIFFTALQHVTGAAWSVPLRRIPEGLGGLFPLMILCFLPLLFGVPSLYEWAHADFVAAHPLLQHKAVYLNVPFFHFRNLFFLIAWSVFGVVFLIHSLRQDKTGDANLTRRNVKLSAFFLVFFALSFTLMSFDVMMSLEPEWYSTIFGVYCFSGLFLSGLAMITLIIIIFKKRGSLQVVNENHLHDLGKLQLAFCVFWAYIAFSQFMLIWYGNLPEETIYIRHRLEGSWRAVSLFLLLGNFVIPFILLLPASLKRNMNYLLFVSVLLLVAHWVDLYWMIYPVLSPEKPVLGLVELGVTAGFIGFFGLVLGAFFSQIALVPQKDPRLEEGLHFHQS